MKCIISLFVLIFSFSAAQARIRMHKVKEAPRTCRLMAEDSQLSRNDKRVLGTPRNSILIESGTDLRTITLVKDKGEKICQWTLEEWHSIQENNKLPDLQNLKFYIDEYKEILYPHIQKADKSWFMMTVPFATCGLTEQVTKEKLELPKCEKPKKSRKKRTAKKPKKS